MESLERVVIRFSGDSGDGMQLTGTQFTNTSALMGNDIATFPDFPAEIRAPKGTVAGVSGFQVQIGSVEISTPGDTPDVLVAMNPAALKANMDSLEKGKVIIIDKNAFTEGNVKKAGYDVNPLEDGTLDGFQLIEAPITDQTLKALEESELDTKSKTRCKNFYALGMTYHMYSRDLESTEKWVGQKFAKKPELIDANIKALKAGYNFADTLQINVSTYSVSKAEIAPGTYRQIDGNTGTALGFVRAAEAAGLNLFLGSYPITPASDILHELSKYKDFGVRTFQAEDEIAGICSAIGASFGGALALTTTSGPGLALKGEAFGLAMILELPLVVVDVQRGGPSTGLPTKTEQSDLNMAMFGRNGESPVVVLACSRPNDCFEMAYMASKIALEHMTPVLLLSDGYIANGAEPWSIPNLDKDFPGIKPRIVNPEDFKDKEFLPYSRDEKTLARPWAIPGMPNLEHRLGGLEKQDGTGNVNYMPKNHEHMCLVRQEKIDRVADFIPEQEVEGEKTGDVLIISWGGTYGSNHMAVQRAQADGKKVSLAHIRYINPFPKNLGDLISGFKHILIPELNLGQLRPIINAKYECGAVGLNKVQGQPFTIREIGDKINQLLES